MAMQSKRNAARGRPTPLGGRLSARVGGVSLATGLFALLAAGATAADGGHDYVGVRKCGVCHKKVRIGDQLGAWNRGPHAGAFATLQTEASQEIAARLELATPAHESMECLECHATAAVVPAERQAYDLALTDGVQCEACHGAGSAYRKKKVMSDPDAARAKGLTDLEQHPELCATCHNERSPTFDPTRYTLPSGGTAGFDRVQAEERIAHPIPAEVKGRYLELADEEG